MKYIMKESEGNLKENSETWSSEFLIMYREGKVVSG